jgi:uncharacterized membrane protein
MRASKILMAISMAAALSASSAFAASATTEKCQVIDKSGKGLIKANKSDCGTTSHSCSAQNEAQDPVSWISVPKGQCEKINAGDFSGVSQEIKDKIEGANNK